MRALKVLLGGLLVVVAIGVIGGLLLPDTTRVERSVVIDRPPSEVYAVLNGFGRFNEWSPWLDYDQTAVYTIEGPASGVGSRMSWIGEKGRGAQQIVDTVQDAEVVVALDFGEQGVAEARYILEPHDAGTRVTWRFDSDADGQLIGRWFGLMFESLIGPDYERGLRQLKQLLEHEPARVGAPAATIDPTPASGADGGEVDVGAGASTPPPQAG